MRSMSVEIEALEPAAEDVRRYLRDHAGVIDADLVDFAAVRSAALAFDDETVRQGFDQVLHEFLATLERVLPHERGLDYVGEARRWGLLQKRIRTLHRDGAGGAFTMRMYGRKVRSLVAEHLEGPEIDQVIAPVSLASPLFDERVRAMPAREAAAEMGHALRFHLEERVKREDPEKYARLSQRLEEILREMPGRFEDQIQEFGPLFEQVRRETEEDPRLAGLTRLEQVVYRLLDRDAVDNPDIDTSRADLRALAEAVCETAARIMGKKSYQGQDQDITLLAAEIETALLHHGMLPGDSGWDPLSALAQGLAAYANGNQDSFRARLRGE
jgi:type I restriction enzyme R subunit